MDCHAKRVKSFLRKSLHDNFFVVVVVVGVVFILMLFCSLLLSPGKRDLLPFYSPGILPLLTGSSESISQFPSSSQAFELQHVNYHKFPESQRQSFLSLCLVAHTSFFLFLIFLHSQLVKQPDNMLNSTSQ